MLSKKYNGSQPSGFDMGHLIFYSLLYSDQNKNVLIGNEYGANLPNTYYEGYPINHQYVKSFDLAKTINQYIHTYITPNFNYNSPFFGFYEYKIAEYFFSLNEYLPLWTSCNNFTKEKRFCGKCAKCASSFLLGLLYKDKDFLKNYFEYYLLNDLSLYKDLLSFTSIKPLDCIGDKKEVWVALYEIYSSGKDTSSDTIKFFLKEIYPSIKDELPLFKKEILSWQNTNLFNDTLIFKAVKEKML